MHSLFFLISNSLLAPAQSSLPSGVIADSARAWVGGSTQPDGPWQYGTYNDTGEFVRSSVRTTYFAGTESWIGGFGEVWDTNGYPRVGKYAMAPGPSKKVVRRWTSNYRGTVWLQVDCQQLQDSRNDQAFELYKNGTQVLSFAKAITSHHLVFLESCPVDFGDTLDFVIEPLGNHQADWTHVAVRIVQDPAVEDVLIHYPFDEEADMPLGRGDARYDRRGRVGDFSGYDHHAVLRNMDHAAPSTAGIHDRARFFDGVDDLVESEAADIGDGLKEFTIAAWVKPSSKGPNVGLVTTTGDYQSLTFSAQGEGLPVEFRAMGQKLIGPSNSCPVDEWTHVVGVWKSGAFQRMYLNGNLAAQHPSPPSGEIDVDKWIVGADRHLPHRHFHGSLDEVLVVPRALTCDKVRDLFREKAIFPGISETAEHFLDGVNDCQPLAASDENGSSEITLAAWVAPFEKGANRAVLSSIGPDFFGLTFNRIGDGFPIEFRAKSVGLVGPGFSCPAGQWNHVAGVWKSGEVQKLYLNGVEVAAHANPPSGTIEIEQWLVGCDRLINNRFYSGLLDDVVVLPTALDGAGVDQLYRQHLHADYVGPVAFNGFLRWDHRRSFEFNHIALETLYQDKRFYESAPDEHSSFLDTSSTGAIATNYSSSHLRGYLTAPETGEYFFWISGRSGAELSISSNN